MSANIEAVRSGQAVLAAECTVAVSSQGPCWDEYLSRSAAATLFHDPRWGKLMATAYHNRPFYLTAWRRGRAAGVLQLLWQESVLFGSHLCSLPYFDAAGVLADDSEAGDALIRRARELLHELGGDWLELRQSHRIGPAIPSRTSKVALRLLLPASAEELWDTLKAKVRNQVRKARRSLAACQGGPELIGDFYRVYVRNMRDLGSPPHSRRFFQLIAENFPESARLFVVRCGDRTVAGSLAFADGDSFRVPWAASDWRVRQSCANMLLYWSMLEHACSVGAGCFDFGRSTRGSGTYRFKRQWGASEVQLYWHYLSANGEQCPEPAADSSKYRLAAACWRKLPVSLARLLGPRIVGKLS